MLANVSPRSYALAVQAAGGMALLLPPDDGAAEQPGEMIDLLDGGTDAHRRHSRSKPRNFSQSVTADSNAASSTRAWLR